MTVPTDSLKDPFVRVRPPFEGSDPMRLDATRIANALVEAIGGFLGRCQSVVVEHGHDASLVIETIIVVVVVVVVVAVSKHDGLSCVESLLFFLRYCMLSVVWRWSTRLNESYDLVIMSNGNGCYS